VPNGCAFAVSTRSNAGSRVPISPGWLNPQLGRRVKPKDYRLATEADLEAANAAKSEPRPGSLSGPSPPEWIQGFIDPFYSDLE
jgi:hypothetical protein